MTANLPTWEVYTNYSSGNYGAHALRFIDADGNSFWFSYQTLVAFCKPGAGKFVRQNDWSTTTGKHLNAIDGGNKKRRLSGEAFEAKFAECFGRKVSDAA